MSDKPTKNEDEYFARRDAELLRQQRETARKSAAELERKTHHMKCPKCGYDLISGDWDGIQIDQCTNCHGIWCDSNRDLYVVQPGAWQPRARRVVKYTRQ